MPKREFVQLAQPFDRNKHHICGWFASEKLDGVRAVWDGGISRGEYADTVPYANTEKDGRLLKRPIATGLWSRYGKVIHAPDWFLDLLPHYPLDGELYMGRGNFQLTVSVTKDHTPGLGWKDVRYHVFDMPHPNFLFDEGVINNTNFKKTFRGTKAWALSRLQNQPSDSVYTAFERVYRFLCMQNLENRVVQIHGQEQLPFATQLAQGRVDEIVDRVVSEGGEGVMLRRHVSTWTPSRTWDCLKVKPYQDDEGIVRGYIWGRRTDLGSKLLGKMGALILDYKGKRLELSGFTDAEREMTHQPMPGQDDSNLWLSATEGERFPGEEVSREWTNLTFPLGSKVTFKYRELTDDGIPKEARYFRKRVDL